MNSPFKIIGAVVWTKEPSWSQLLPPLAEDTGTVELDLGGPPERQVLGVMISGHLVFRYFDDCRFIAVPGVGAN